MSGVIGTRWAAARRLGGYGAAASLSLYLAVKVVWVAAAAFGHVPAHFGGADWIVLNVVTVGMSATGIALGLVLARGMRWRIPAAPLVFLTWVGGGFLIPLMPYSMVSALLGGGGEETGGDAAPSWEMTFIGIGFTGMAIGLAIALPIYMRERWPTAFLGRLSDRNRTAVGRARTAAVLTAVPAAFWTLWSAGAELGLDPAHRDLVDVNTRLLLGDSALWALLGVWSVLAVSSARPNMPAWLPTAIGFTASGSLFAWGGWKLAVAVFRPGGYTSAEYPIAAIALNGLAAAGGLLMLSTLLASLRASAAPPANAPPANAQVGNAQVGNAQVGNAQVANAQVANAQVANARTGNMRTGNVQSGNVQTGNVQTGNVQSGNVQSGNVQTGNAQAGEG